jgi:hypothetical protein
MDQGQRGPMIFARTARPDEHDQTLIIQFFIQLVLAVLACVLLMNLRLALARAVCRSSGS